MIVIPKPNDWVRAIVLVTQGAQAGRAQKQISPRQSGTRRQPSTSQDSQEMPAGKEQYVSLYRPDALHDSVSPLADLRG